MFGSEFLFSPVALHATGTIGIPTPSVSSKLCFRHFSILLSCGFLTSFLHPTTHREEGRKKTGKGRGGEEARSGVLFSPPLSLQPKEDRGKEGLSPSLLPSLSAGASGPFLLPLPIPHQQLLLYFPKRTHAPSARLCCTDSSSQCKKRGGVSPPCIRCQHGSSVGGEGGPRVVLSIR